MEEEWKDERQKDQGPGLEGGGGGGKWIESKAKRLKGRAGK